MPLTLKDVFNTEIPYKVKHNIIGATTGEKTIYKPMLVENPQAKFSLPKVSVNPGFLGGTINGGFPSVSTSSNVVSSFFAAPYLLQDEPTSAKRTKCLPATTLKKECKTLHEMFSELAKIFIPNPTVTPVRLQETMRVQEERNGKIVSGKEMLISYDTYLVPLSSNPFVFTYTREKPKDHHDELAMASQNQKDKYCNLHPDFEREKCYTYIRKIMKKMGWGECLSELEKYIATFEEERRKLPDRLLESDPDTKPAATLKLDI